MDKRTNQTTPISQLIADSIPEVPTRPRKPSTYDYLKKTNPEHNLVVEYDKNMKIYDDYYAKQRVETPKKEPVVIPDLHPIHSQSFYNLFKFYYQKINNCEFNENANNKEAYYFAKTLIYYFSKDENFLKSPLLSNINNISMDKGLLVIGGFGCGKTSIFKTMHQLFFNAQRESIPVYDVEKNIQSLARYKMQFKYFTANQVVEEYESCENPGEKEYFWNRQNKGFTYYDDILTEREASNYGKVEIFKDIFEKRYSDNAKTMISCNYYGDTVETTLAEFGKKYGGRVYDRLFSMFNIIELKGKSLRK